jgi:hypothetical protein
VGGKFKDHFDAFEKELFLLTDLPRLRYNTLNPQIPFFELYLPPRTAFYTTSEVLWKSLNITGDMRLRKTERSIGAKGQRAQYKLVHGFFNTSPEAWTIRGREMLAGTSMNDLAGVAEFPKFILCQIELTNTPRLLMPVIRGEAMLQPATKANALRIWKHQAERIAEYLKLPDDILEVYPGDRDSIIWSCTARPGAGIRITLELNGVLGEAAELAPGQSLVFNVAKGSKYELTLKTYKDDPFHDMYPVMVKANAFSNAISWVDGVGEVTVFGIIDEKTARHPIISTGLVFGTDKTRLTVEFYDKHRKLVSFKQNHNIGMLMLFRSL